MRISDVDINIVFLGLKPGSLQNFYSSSYKLTVGKKQLLKGTVTQKKFRVFFGSYEFFRTGLGTSTGLNFLCCSFNFIH